jgi:hypothetical protein
MTWYKSLYWRIALGVIGFLAAMLIVQAMLFVWAVSQSGRSLPGQSPARFSVTIALDLSSALERDPATDLTRYVHDQYAQYTHPFFVMLVDGTLITSGSSTVADPLLGMARAAIQRWTEHPPGRRGERPEGPRFERPMFSAPPAGFDGPGRGGPGRRLRRRARRPPARRQLDLDAKRGAGPHGPCVQLLRPIQRDRRRLVFLGIDDLLKLHVEVPLFGRDWSVVFFVDAMTRAVPQSDWHSSRFSPAQPQDALGPSTGNS